MNQIPTSPPGGTTTARSEPSRKLLWGVLLCNLPFLLALTAIEHLGALPRSIIVGLLLFLVPGAVWTDWRGRDGFVILFRTVLLSLAASLLSWVFALALPGATNRAVFLLALCAVTNAGLLRGYKQSFYDTTSLRTPLVRWLSLCALLFYAQSFVGAHRVPALEDHDMETQGTAYGLIHHLAPTMVTNRGTTHFFAHPLLLHFWIGASALISDDLDALAYYHHSAVAVRDLPGARDVVPLDQLDTLPPWAARFKQSVTVSPEYREQLDARWKLDFAQFQKTPVLLPTRIPNLFLAAFTLFPLGFLVYRISGSRLAAIGSCLLYATLPEIYVRSVYGGYMAITNFVTLGGAYFYLRASGLLTQRADAPDADQQPRAGTFVSGFVGAWVNQKWLIVAAAAGLHATIRVVSDINGPPLLQRARQSPAFIAGLLVAIGFFTGWASYFVYGLSVSHRDFVSDHLLGHVLSRVRMNKVSLTEVQAGYPSIVALWAEFGRHLNWLFAAVASVSVVRAFRHVRRADGVFLIWVLIGAVGFSLVDWRMTKHLSKIIPPLVVLTGLFWASLNPKARIALSVPLAVACLWNVWTIGQLMQDFTYLQPSPMW
jgi:hypothetical protein